MIPPPEKFSARVRKLGLGDGVRIIAYDQRRYDEAVTELRKVPDRYPESSKAAPALRKIGDAYRAQGDTERGQAAYRELVERYPNSSEAEAARRELGS